MIGHLVSAVTDTVVPGLSNGTAPLALGAVGTAIGGVAAYLAARRKGSGKVDTTDAGTLWGASEDFRKDQATEITSLRSDNAALRAENAQLRNRLDKLEGKR